MENKPNPLLNVVLSVLAPVLILQNCSESSEKIHHLGTTWAMVLALALPIGYGGYLLATTRKFDPLNILGLIGTILTGVVTFYGTAGEGNAIHQSTPWWYAAKEALIPILMGLAIVITAKGEGALLRVFVYTDAVFDIKRIESEVSKRGQLAAYNATLWKASLMTAGTLVLSSVANFALALIYLLPVLELPASEQALEYNHAVGTLTWIGYLVIGIPLMGTLIAVIVYLVKALCRLTGLGADEVRMG